MALPYHIVYRCAPRACRYPHSPHTRGPPCHVKPHGSHTPPSPPNKSSGAGRLRTVLNLRPPSPHKQRRSAMQQLTNDPCGPRHHAHAHAHAPQCQGAQAHRQGLSRGGGRGGWTRPRGTGHVHLSTSTTTTRRGREETARVGEWVCCPGASGILCKQQGFGRRGGCAEHCPSRKRKAHAGFTRTHSPPFSTAPPPPFPKAQPRPRVAPQESPSHLDGTPHEIEPIHAGQGSLSRRGV